MTRKGPDPTRPRKYPGLDPIGSEGGSRTRRCAAYEAAETPFLHPRDASLARACAPGEGGQRANAADTRRARSRATREAESPGTRPVEAERGPEATPTGAFAATATGTLEGDTREEACEERHLLLPLSM